MIPKHIEALGESYARLGKAGGQWNGGAIMWTHSTVIKFGVTSLKMLVINNFLK